MTDFNQNVNEAKDMLNLEDKDMKKLPQMLNVLTILTYIGCALAAIKSIWDYFSISASYKLIGGMNLTDLPGTENSAAKSLISQSLDMVKKQYDNRLIILILSLVGVALCFYGAMQMRNLKKQGFLFYLVGEILPIITFAVFIGFGSLLGSIGTVLISIVAIVFIILYNTQRKHLVN